MRDDHPLKKRKRMATGYRKPRFEEHAVGMGRPPGDPSERMVLLMCGQGSGGYLGAPQPDGRPLPSNFPAQG